MEKIVWTPELSVGVDVFDEHHKHVILMINRLIDAQKEGTNAKVVSDLLDRMASYARNHLKAEEKMMAENGYPEFEQHKAQHMIYVKKIVGFCTAIQIDATTPTDLLSYLRNWWEHHIQNSDKAYATFFNDIGIR